MKCPKYYGDGVHDDLPFVQWYFDKSFDVNLPQHVYYLSGEIMIRGTGRTFNLNFSEFRQLDKPHAQAGFALTNESFYDRPEGRG